MKKDQVKIGQVYRAKVSDRIVPVRIEKENVRGGWDAINLHTNRAVRIKSAQRLRGRVTMPGTDAETKTPVKKVTVKEHAEQTQAASEDGTAPRSKRSGMSCLDAAVRVLEEAGEPMNTRAMVEAMAAKGYWTTSAPTPAATLYSAILREMQKKGDDARFTKVERGKFTLAKGG